ncbi:unnamed protein product [Mytilus coruscus]|uniref:Uncharacterized protein n=1 Tax=Mytilus coruscus TaxID=42192 RepID=A0A6J8AQM4_MYTCO|nr:unnamed protein product [Mytilus coruscus]
MSHKLRKFIVEQPQIPSGFRYKTPILVSDSKGFTIRNSCRDKEFPTELWCIPGAKTADLVDLIENRLEKAIKRHYHIILYFWSGTCDFTIKQGKFIKLRHNQEHKTVNSILTEYKRAITIVEKYPNTEIKFVDCPILSIVNYNKHKGHTNPATFKVEDFLVTRQIQNLNTKISELNQGLRKNTVKTSKYFFRARKVKRGGYRKSVNISLNKTDGVHSGPLLSLVITKQLLLDTYRECFHIATEAEEIQLRVSKEELLSLF